MTTDVGMKFDFGEALKRLKDGKAVRRGCWVSLQKCVYLNKGSFPPNLQGVTRLGWVDSKHFELGDTGTLVRMPNLNLNSDTGVIVSGWAPSQIEMLAEDWMSVQDTTTADKPKKIEG